MKILQPTWGCDGQVNVHDIPITNEQMYEWRASSKTLKMVAPQLTEQEREIVQTGLSEAQFNKMF